MTANLRWMGRPLLAAVAFVIAVAPAARADEATVLRLRAQQAAAAGRCGEALPLLAQARQLAPNDARAALAAGQCQIAERQYADAVVSLEEAQRLDPGLAGTDLYLGIARFHQEDLAGAEEALERARQRNPDRAEVQLYLGMLALQRAESAEAAAAFARAREADPEAVEPIASYYEGLARDAEGDRIEARRALERAAALGAGTVWAQEATAALARLGEVRDPPWKLTSPRALERMTERSSRWWVIGTVGFEWDDNVVLRGNETQLPNEISSERDIRAVWWVEAGYELISTPRWTVGVMGNYFGSAQRDLNDFNTQFPRASLWVDHRPAETVTARLQYDFGYAWVGGNSPFLSEHVLTPALYKGWGRHGTTRLYSRFVKRNFYFANQDVRDGPGEDFAPCVSRNDIICSPVGIQEERERNRNGWGFTAGIDHVWPLPWSERVVVRAGYRYHRYSSRGSEYSFQGHEGQLGVRTYLPYDLAFEVFGSYTYAPFRNASTFPNPNLVFLNRQYPLSSDARRDWITRIDVVLERPITDWLLLSFRYAWFDNRSNVDVFDYDRQIAGVYATFRFGP